MNKVEIIKGINATIKGLETIKEALETETQDVVADEKTAVTKETKVVEKKAQKETVKTPDVESTEGSADVLDVETLKSMKYNEFKKYASQLGVKCTGTRDEIMERILALDGATAVEEEDVEETPVVEKKTTKSKSKAKAKAKVEEEEEPSKDEFELQAEEIAKDTPITDIIEILAEVEVKATKKNAVSKLAHALREGLIELEDGDDDDDEEDSTEDSDDEEISADSYFVNYDPEGYNDPENMSDERKEAIETKMGEIITAYSEEELTTSDVSSYVEDNATQEEIDLLGDEYTEEEILMLYMELVKRTIDDEGEEHEPAEPYELNEKEACCGHTLKYVKKTKQFICEHCGTEYEVE